MKISPELTVAIAALLVVAGLCAPAWADELMYYVEGDRVVFTNTPSRADAKTVPGFADVVADARKRGFYISIGTNAVYTDEQLEWLPYCGIDWFIISLDGDRETNDRIRGRGTFDRVVHSIKILSKNPSIRIRLILQQFGFALLLLLMLSVTVMDVGRFFG